MKKYFIFFLLINLFFINLASAKSPDFIKEKNTSGEVYVTLLPVKDSEIIYILLSFQTGSVRDPEGKDGLNLVCEELIDENIRKNINEKALTSGAEYFSLADKEITTYFFKVHKDKFNETFPIFISEIISPSVGENTLQIAKDNVLNLREGILNDSETLSKIMLELFIYKNHPYGRPDFGTKKSVANITVQDVKDFYRRFYTAGNYSLGIGGYNTSHVSEMLKKELNKLSHEKFDGINIPEPKNHDGIKVLIVKAPVPSTAVSMGFPVDFTRSDKDYYPLRVANSSFGEHRYMHGLLFRKLREVRGFNYGNYSYIEKFIEGSQDKMPQARVVRQKQYFSLWLRNLGDENAVFATKFAIMSLHNMVTSGLSDERFFLMNDFVVNNSGLWHFDPFQKLGFSMDSDFYHIPYFIDHIGEKLKGMKNKEVSEALKKHMNAKNMKIVFITSEPEKMKDKLLGKLDIKPVYNTVIPSDEQKTDLEVLKYDLKIKAEDIEIIDGETLF